MELRRVAPVVGLVALLAADAVLIAWALRPAPVDSFVPAGTSTSTSSSTATGTGTATSRPTASVSAKPGVVAPAPIADFVASAGSTDAWVVRAGSCEKPGRVWVTGDQGGSWNASELPGRVLRLRPTNDVEAFGTGGDAECGLRLWSTTNAGDAWSRAKDAGDAWSRDPADAHSVHTSSGAVVQPCGARLVIDLTVLSTARASVLCENGDVRSTTDGGRRWPKRYTVEGALALTLAVEGGTGVVLRSDASCTGVVAVPIRSNEPVGTGECVRAQNASGRASVSTGGGGWWMLVGDAVFTADDSLGPWTQTRQNVTG